MSMNWKNDINEPWSRFYVQKPIGGGNGANRKRNAKAAVVAWDSRGEEIPF